MRRVSLVVAVLISGCLEPKLVTCPGDELCPVGTLCDTVHGGCISPDQAQACVGVADHEACRAGSVIGYCLDQICIDPKCGNHIVEPGELCDDGNRVDGDGCSATCMSREQCGDGALDRQLGEECDDGNLLSHDGCDSRCLEETPMWTVDALGPSRAEPQWTTYDPQVGKVVLVADGYVWAWDGARWSVAGTGGPRIADAYSVAYDTLRTRLVVIAAHPQSGDTLDPNPPRDQLYEWDGTTWTIGTLANAPAVSSFVVTYDELHARVFGFGTNIQGVVVTAALDITNRTWTTVAPPNGFTGATDKTIAFDTNRGRVVVVATVGATAVTGEWNGTTWTVSSPTMVATGGWSAFYDSSITRVVVIGTSSTGTTTPAQSWNGAAWSSLTALPQLRYQPSAAFDATRGVRVVFGGESAGIPDDIVEGSGASWAIATRTTPPPGVDNVCGVDEGRHRLVCVGPGETLSDTWAWTGTWIRIPGDVGEPPPAITYDPVRATMVSIVTGQMVVLDDAGWHSVGLQGPIAPALALVFDPTSRQLVASVTELFSNVTNTLFIDEQNQTRSFPSTPLTSLAFDARNRAVVGTTYSSAVQLTADTWTPIVSPGAGFKAITNARRGTVEFVGPPHDVERSGLSWIDLAAAPIQLVGASAFDQSTGELFTIGVDGVSRFMLHRRWDSVTPFEDCSSTIDSDGDGLAGCDDPDCWTVCQPACPPLTTCP